MGKMLNRFTMKGRMYLIVFAIFILFIVMALFAVRNSDNIREIGLSKTQQIMSF